MSQTIIELWNGNIAPYEYCGSHDPQANQLIDLIERNRQSLCNSLDAAQTGIFHKYIDCSEEYLLRMLELAFREGFSLASRLISEAFSESTILR